MPKNIHTTRHPSCFTRYTIITLLALPLTVLNGCKSEPEKQLQPTNIILKGNIDEGYEYSVEVIYYAKKNARKCVRYSLFAQGYHPKIQQRRYKARVINGRHHLSFPVNELQIEREYCDWNPHTIQLCLIDLNKPGNLECNELFAIGLPSSVSIESYLPADTFESSDKQPLLLECPQKEHAGPARRYCDNSTKIPQRIYKALKTKRVNKLPLILFPSNKAGMLPYKRPDEVFTIDISLPAAH